MLLAIGIVVHCDCLFNQFHDHSVLMLVIALVWWSFGCSKPGQKRISPLISGLIGGSAAMVSPVCAATWATLFTVKNRERPWHIGIAAFVSMLVIAPWITRNAIQFGEFVPIKSNTSFELWQSCLVDADGVLDTQTFQLHPFSHQGEQLASYVALGESNYLRQKRRESFQWIVANQGDMTRRICNRFIAAFVWYQPVSLNEYGTWYITGKRVWTLTLLACIFVILAGKKPIPPAVTDAVLIHAVFLLPYVLVSYYDRYFWSTLPMQFIIIGYVSIQCRDACNRHPWFAKR